jgi:uncharacterized protein YndB with AHSA1/START domain
MIRVLVVVLAVLVAACGVVYYMGSRQPVAHTAAVRAHFHAPPETLFKIVLDVKRYPEWRPDVKSVSLLGTNDPNDAWQEVGKKGTLEYTFSEISPPERIVSTLKTTDAGFTGRWRFRFLADSTGTDVNIMEEGSVQNPFFRFAMRYVFGPYSSLETYMTALGKRAGETVKVERVP